jgi:hypothetical protein
MLNPDPENGSVRFETSADPHHWFWLRYHLFSKGRGAHSGKLFLHFFTGTNLRAAGNLADPPVPGLLLLWLRYASVGTLSLRVLQVHST